MSRKKDKHISRRRPAFSCSFGETTGDSRGYFNSVQWWGRCRPQALCKGLTTSALGDSWRCQSRRESACPPHQAHGCWMVSKEALASLGMKLSQGSCARRRAPISGHLGPYKLLNSPSPSGKWEDSLPPRRRGWGGGQRSGPRKAPSTREPASPGGWRWLARPRGQCR